MVQRLQHNSQRHNLHLHLCGLHKGFEVHFAAECYDWVRPCDGPAGHHRPAHLLFHGDFLQQLDNQFLQLPLRAADTNYKPSLLPEMRVAALQLDSLPRHAGILPAALRLLPQHHPLRDPGDHNLLHRRHRLDVHHHRQPSQLPIRPRVRTLHDRTRLRVLLPQKGTRGALAWQILRLGVRG